MPIHPAATPARPPGDGAFPCHPSPVHILRAAADVDDCLGRSGAAGPAGFVGVGLGVRVRGGVWVGAGGGAGGGPGRPIEAVGRVELRDSGEGGLLCWCWWQCWYWLLVLALMLMLALLVVFVLAVVLALVSVLVLVFSAVFVPVLVLYLVCVRGLLRPLRCSLVFWMIDKVTTFCFVSGG